jgi:hypothetical protein
MKVLSILILFIIALSADENIPSVVVNSEKRDTVSGYFLYEVNVAYKCYSRFDQIEQGNNLILYDSLMSNLDIKDLYKHGVFYFEYQYPIVRYIENHKKGLSQVKEDISRFNDSISSFRHVDDSSYMKTLVYDNSKVLSYKLVYAKFIVVHLGKLKQLIPTTQNFRCCYSNTIKEIDTYFITDILEFKIY